MGKTQTVAVSLSSEIAARLKEEAQRNGKGASQVVREALEAHFRQGERERLREAYRLYFSDSRNRTEERRITREFLHALSWPKD